MVTGLGLGLGLKYPRERSRKDEDGEKISETDVADWINGVDGSDWS